MAPQPGLLDLTTLAIHGTNLAAIDVGEIRQVTKYQTLLLDRKLKGTVYQNAARNLIGLTLYKSGRKEDAIEKWKETLTIDEFNLNALKDLCTAYREMGDTAELAEYERRLQRAQETDIGRIGLEERKERCRIEQAYARSYDIPPMNNEARVNKAKARQLVQAFEAVQTGENHIINSDDQYWKLNTFYFLALALNDLSRHLPDQQQFQTVSNSITLLARSEEQSRSLQHWKLLAQILCNLGNIYSYRQVAGQNPDQYYRQALNHDPDDSVWIYATWGESCRVRKDLDNALHYCSESIRIAEGLPLDDPTRESRRYAYGYRGKVKRDQARQMRAKLLEAKQDLQTAYDIHPNRKIKTTLDSVRNQLDSLG